MNIPDTFSNTGVYYYDLRVAENISFSGPELKKKKEKREGKGLREREEEEENRQHSTGRIRPPRFAYPFWAYEPWETL